MDDLLSAIITLLLCTFIQNTTCLCNVTCYTDYISSLNCTCQGQVPQSPYELAIPRTNDSNPSACQLKHNRNIGSIETWCLLNISDLDDFYTVCAYPENKSHPEHCATIELREMIKPQPPFNVTIEKSDNDYNMSWEMMYTEEENYYLNGELVYEVRYKTTYDSWENQRVCHIYNDIRSYIIANTLFESGKEYVFEIRAGVNNESGYSGTWSEWSKPAILTSPSVNRRSFTEIFSILVLSISLAVLSLYAGKMLLKKHCPFIPSPEDFFKPLYIIHNGDFKSWVGHPHMFTGFDFVEKNTVVPIVKSKEESVKNMVELGDDITSRAADRTSNCGFMCRSMASNSSSKLYFSSGSMASVLKDNSIGHISIDTVTVSAEDALCCPQWPGAEEDEAYRGSDESYDYSSAGVLDGSSLSEEDSLLSNGPENRPSDMVILCSCVSEDTKRSPCFPLNSIMSSNPIALYDLIGNDSEPGDQRHLPDEESLSLNSFESNSRSEGEDGYPKICLDLDTIDSGFTESGCSSPVESDFHNKDETNLSVLGEREHSSNYVKQWVAYTVSPPGDSSSSN
ncbi:interleukin 21 receptor, tandem duplicate 1 isoform X2 [Erpetoichthys calabaricus]|uniref:interleukin 21 receptor, tandem duplicate 1 isoform X2 n=1 Tax=Erpetoichthys calabaricus TaxID=27687 RepID=UPI00109FFA7D|nr:interleukin 21 receptor, tandem duplicate 1 isoform X2 [Erpetoichthys calabaricus]